MNTLTYENKLCGETMTMFLNRIKKNYAIDVTYVARLDPMAQGKVPIIPKSEFNNIRKYFNSNKKYQVRVIFGYQTDSDDVLGIIQNKKEILDISKYKSYFEKCNYTFHQKYHYFSSKRNTKRKIKKDENYTHQVTIYNSKIISQGSLSFFHWKNQVISDIEKIDKTKNFRQEEIIEQWSTEQNDNISYLDLELNVSSGFFVRQFIRDISEEINIPILAFKINRMCVDCLAN